jgi:hypothetical protein
MTLQLFLHTRMTQHFVMAADRIIGMRTGDPSTWPGTFAAPPHAGFGGNPDAGGQVTTGDKMLRFQRIDATH